MRIRLMHLGIAAVVLSWGWAAEAQLQRPQRPPVPVRTLEIEGPAIGGSIAVISPFGDAASTSDIGFHVELPIAHAVSFRADVGLADWNAVGTTSPTGDAGRVGLARGTFVVVGRPHDRPGQYLGAGFGVYRFQLGGYGSTVRRAPGGTLLGGVEVPFSRKLVVGLELQGH